MFFNIRYALIIIPAIASMYLENFQPIGWYIFHILLLLCLLELRRNISFLNTSILVIGIEIGYLTWIAITYEGFLYCAFYSILFANYNLRPLVHRISSYILGLVGLNVVMLESSHSITLLLMGANLAYIIICILLYYIQSLISAKLNTEHLNDQLRRKHYELDETQKQLVDFAKKVENAAQLEERNRISREIHDELGHKLIRLKLMMDAAVRILPIQPEKGMEMIESVRAQLSDSMEMLRATVRKLNPGVQILRSYSLEKLVDDVRNDGRLTIEYQVEGLPYAPYPSIEIILFRNAQEAITNAVRHGEAKEITVRVIYQADEIIMHISNDGLLPAHINNKGLGVSGMEERVQLVGGKLHINPEFPFTVTTTLPSGQQRGY